MKRGIKNLTNKTDKRRHDFREGHPRNAELKKSKMHCIAGIIDYVIDAVISKTILKKTTGNITILSYAEGKESEERTSPFDYYIQVIDGSAVVRINKKMYTLRSGEGIVIPAHASHCFNAAEQFKMISTVIKSGYEK
jgi:quercetin dioxygenase-like cupin family protein